MHTTDTKRRTNPMSKSKLFFIDLETTGLSAYKNGVWQFGGIIDVAGKTEKITCEMKPFPNDVIEDKALAVSGKTKEEILALGSPFDFYAKLTSTMARYIDKFNKADKFYMIGYNVSFDEGFLRQWLRKCGDNYFGSYFYWPCVDVANIAASKIISKNLTRPEKNFKLGLSATTSEWTSTKTTLTMRFTI